VLTPEKPDYEGGAWHVEGMGNESIVATAIYYYLQENVTQSTLAFREAAFKPDYEHLRRASENLSLKASL
jgi:hypothetical protein